MKEFSSFTDLEKLLFTFEETLKQNGIDIAPDSGLGRVGLAVLDLLQKKNHPSPINRKEDVRAYFADILGVRTFMTKIVALRDHAGFAQLVPHLRKLNEGHVSQNSASGVLDQVSPKLFELLIALGAMQIGSNLELDDPDLSAGGKNPDVLVTVDDVRYGLACKALFGTSTATLIQNLNKGIDQIEKSPADAGFVIVNVKDLIKHEICWPSPEAVDFPEGSEVDSVAWPDLSFVLSYLEGLATKRVLDLAIPVVVHFLHTATAIAGPSSPVATSVLFLHLYGYGATFIQKMNAALQDQLLPI